MHRRRKPTLEGLLLEVISEIQEVGRKVDSLIEAVPGGDSEATSRILGAAEKLKASTDALETTTNEEKKKG